jgi:hypothetical protein
VLLLVAPLIAIIMPFAASDPPPCEGPTATRLVTGLEGASGSTIGPDGALYVTEGALGRISRVDPQTGEKTTFASGLPPAIIGIGGAIRERSGGIDRALHLAVDEQLVQEFAEPLIETPRERRAPDGVGMNVRLGGAGTTDGSGRFVCGGSVRLRGAKRVKGCMASIVLNHSAFRKRNRFGLLTRIEMTESVLLCTRMKS